MLTGEHRNQVDQIWNAFWSGGVSNPLSVIEQITYLLFIKRLDDMHTLAESKAQMLGRPMERRIFPEGEEDRGDAGGCAYADMRWSRFIKHFEPREMMAVVDKHVFPFLRTLGDAGSSYGRHMRDARLGFSNLALLAKVVEMLGSTPHEPLSADDHAKNNLPDVLARWTEREGSGCVDSTRRDLRQASNRTTLPAWQGSWLD